MDHIKGNSSNPHLHNALLKYGLSHYAFVILEYCLSSDLLKREQHFLDLLDTLPKELCYNFLPLYCRLSPPPEPRGLGRRFSHPRSPGGKIFVRGPGKSKCEGGAPRKGRFPPKRGATRGFSPPAFFLNIDIINLNNNIKINQKNIFFKYSSDLF